MGELRDRFLADGRPDTPFERFSAAVEYTRRIYPQMTIGAFATFVTVASLRGRSLPSTATTLAAQLGVPVTTIFRQCDQLSDGVRGAPGMKLLNKEQGEKDSRERALKITIDGLNLLTGIHDLIAPDDT